MIEDARKCVTLDFKKPGNWILLIGETKEEFGGSHLNEVLKADGGEVPKVDGPASLELMRKLHAAMQKGLVRACHDLSEGGLGVGLAEMCIAGNLGAKIDFKEMNPAVFIFSESATRWIVEVEPKHLAALKKIFAGAPLTTLGKVDKRPALKIKSKKELIGLSVSEMSKAWHSFSEAQ